MNRERVLTLEIGSCTILPQEVVAKGLRTTRGNRIDKKYLYRMLSNRAYIGEAVHRGDARPLRRHHRDRRPHGPVAA